MELRVKPRDFTAALLFVILTLVTAHIAGQLVFFNTGKFALLAKAFDLDQEKNFPTYFASVILLFSALLLLIIAAINRQSGDRWRHYWLALALIFFFMSIDELVAFHDHINQIVKELLPFAGKLHFAWVIPYLAGAGLLLFWYTRFLFSLPFQTRLLFLTAGLLYVSGAAGMEIISGQYFACIGGIQKNFTYSMLTAVEETLEMVGIALFIYALMHYIDVEFHDLCLRVTSQPQHVITT